MHKAQSSFELLITLSFGLAILLPIVVIAFIQLASANTSLSAISAQEAASKLSGVASLVGSEGSPAKELVQIVVPANVRYIYVGTPVTNAVGHEIVFVISSPTGLTDITAYSPVNVSGQLSGIASEGTYLVNVSAQAHCQTNYAVPCVYMSEVS
ncbi:MAG: hypothetical protein QXT43_00710 [Candidatus Micrarchaeaceae archaeon]